MQAHSLFKISQVILVTTVLNEDRMKLLNSDEYVMINTGPDRQRCSCDPGLQAGPSTPVDMLAIPLFTNHFVLWLTAIASKKLMFREVIQHMQNH